MSHPVIPDGDHLLPEAPPVRGLRVVLPRHGAAVGGGGGPWEQQHKKEQHGCKNALGAK